MGYIWTYRRFYASFFVALFKLYTASEQNIDSMWFLQQTY